jgi:hypothetical protein
VGAARFGRSHLFQSDEMLAIYKEAGFVIEEVLERDPYSDVET